MALREVESAFQLAQRGNEPGEYAAALRALREAEAMALQVMSETTSEET